MIGRTVIAAAAFMAVAAVGPAGVAVAGKPAHGKTRTVGVKDDFYDPGKLTVHVGDKVKWVWHANGFSLHDVYVDAGPTDFHSPTQGAGSYSYTFKKAGTYKLYCSQHEEDMTMTITVKKAPKKK
jgi:plastocyanin